MRAVKFLATGAGFPTDLVGLTLLSAVTTSTVHSAINPRAAPTGFILN